MSPIVSVSGLASGVQWQDLIDQVIAAERAQRVTPISGQIDANQKRIEAWKSFQTLVSRLETAARALNDGTSYRSFVANGGTSLLSGRSLVTATAGAAAVPASYDVEVLQLARAEKLASGPVTDITAALDSLDPGFTGGTFTINGREVVLAAADSLAQVRDKINAANTGTNPSGVTASILTVGPNDHRLILTSVNTGAAGIRIGEGDGQVLGQLGISSTSQSAAFGDTASPLAGILGLSSPPAVRTIVIEGREITVDLANDSLQSVLNRIQAAAAEAGEDPGEAASIVNDGAGFRLQVRGSVTGRADDEDTRAVLAALGFGREGLTTPGTNSLMRIDGIEVGRTTNSVSDAVQGVALNLQGAEAGTTVQLDIARDTDAMVAAVKEFAAAYTELRAFVDGQRGEGKPLASNSTLRGAMTSFTNVMLTSIDELETAFSRAAEVGVSLSRTGTLDVDEAKLRAAISSNPADVHALFAGRTGDPPVEGLAGRMMTAAASIVRAGDGTVSIQLDSLDRSNTSLQRRLGDAETRLELRRQTLVDQFARMETALSALNAQGDWLTSQLDALKPRTDK